MFRHMLEGRLLEKLVDAIRASRMEHVWAEPFNDRKNWDLVRSCMEAGSVDQQWMTAVYETKELAWSSHATELYLRLKAVAARQGWIHKLRYLLYEGDITQVDAPQFAGFAGVLLQSKPDDNDRSQNSFIAALQAKSVRRAR
jgi:hypothetical protein